jgi:hypothetical protein
MAETPRRTVQILARDNGWATTTGSPGLDTFSRNGAVVTAAWNAAGNLAIYGNHYPSGMGPGAPRIQADPGHITEDVTNWLTTEQVQP